MHNPKCAAMHLDMWCVKTDWIQAQLRAIRSGVLLASPDKVARTYDGTGYPITNGIAVIELSGSLMKGWSKYGGTSTMWARSAIRDADRNSDVKAIMMHIDSPGGTSAGTAELGDDIRNSKKPIHAHIDDLGASAAYWAASQADHISINRAGLAGSIGTYAAIHDTSGAAEMEGIKVHVVSTGSYKGAGEEGTPVTEEQLAYWQQIVNAHFAIFETAVREGRHMLKAQFNKVSDGRVFSAEESKSLGLIDSVESFDKALKRLSSLEGSK
ncbi:S49 family peptidase [Candidatus Pacearchaeota archaeon]|jgi:signal peptide peptidase SppA|nr:S49 family peptidase [Candidatus Pacearchaeota archaeon]